MIAYIYTFNQRWARK